jgi:SAM-dependent methyltransferase
LTIYDDYRYSLIILKRIKGNHAMAPPEAPIKKFDADTARDFARVASEVFAPIYPVIAGQILRKCHPPTTGWAIDLGSGAGHLALALAQQTRLRWLSYDFSMDIQLFAHQNIRRSALSHRISPLQGDARMLPFADRRFQLAVSRGSVLFLEDRIRAFREIQRVLVPGGQAYVGGGMGTGELARKIDRAMRERDPSWSMKYKKTGRRDTRVFHEMAHSLGISTYDVINDDSGIWFWFKKAETP